MSELSTNNQSYGCERYVPSYKVIFDHPKSHDYCLVIPVINEGQRILSLLSKIRELNLTSMVDIIIVDGGTTDGSLDNLEQYKVNTLLLKTGKGKLSAQLLCAYAFAIDREYQGILTIDGNDKDDPSAIPSFIEKLKEGYDFVQASRFIDGGVAVNTPKSRDFAIKYIHAPVLSFASGFHWTDTTQGFRAYSLKLLNDSRVNVFRECFSGYELLAYLNYIAPRLKFKCIERPSKRSYPKGKAPTKISSFKGNFEVLKLLFKTVLGKYNTK